MEQFIQATILGLATASILAVAASGLVLTYTTTGIFNFAHGALGMLGAFAYWQLTVDWGVPIPIALLIVLGVLAPLVGALIEVVIMRGLTDAPESVRVVVSISLLVALLGAGLWIWDPQRSYPTRRLWSNGAFHLTDSIRLPYHELTAFAVAVGLALGLRLLLYSSRTGVAMRAAVDDRPLAALNAARPDRSAMLAWAIGCSCAALAGILITPIITLTHQGMTLLIVNAYAAAMIGRLRSLPLTFGGAVILGLLDQWSIAYLPSSNQFLAQLRFVIPVVVLFGALMLLRQPRPRGGVRRTREVIPRPAWPGALVTAGAFVLIGLYLSQILTESDARSVTRILGLAIIALSLVPLAGFSGQLSLCQMSFAGIGAVVMAHHGTGGSPMGLLYAAVITGAIGAVVAIPAIRLGGLYFALATGAFAVFMDRWLFVLRPFDVGPITIRFFDSGSLPSNRVDLPGSDTHTGMVLVLAVVFALLYLLVVGVRRSGFGQRLLALKESPAAAATLGMNVTMAKLAVFSLSAAMAGLGGALYSGTYLSVSPERFAFFESLPLLLLTVVGGIGAASGALFAGVMLGGIPIVIDMWPWFEKLSYVLPGLMGIALARNPNGATQEIRAAFAPLKRHPAALALTVVSLVAVLGLRLADVVSGGAMVLLLMAAGVSGLLLLRLTGAEDLDEHRPRPPDDGPDPDGDVPLEWVGIDRPFTSKDGAELDRALGFDMSPEREAVRS